MAMAVQMATAPWVARASMIDEAIQSQVEASRAAATNYARAAVWEDLGQVLDRMFAQMKEYSESRELPQLYGKYLADVEDELLNVRRSLGTLDQASLEVFKSQSQKFGEAIRKRFQASWIPNVQTGEYEYAREMLRGVLEDAKLTCDLGRSRSSGNFMTPGPKPAPFVEKFQVHVDPNYAALLRGGSPITAGYSYTAVTAGSRAANRDRARIVATTTSLSNVANGAVLNVQSAALLHAIAPVTFPAMSSGGMLGAVSSGMVAAAPYLAAIAAAVIITVHFAAQAEASRITERYIRAHVRQMRDSADHEFVNAAYRDICKPYSAALERIVKVLEGLEGPERASLLQEAQGNEDALKLWQKESLEEDERSCRLELNQMYDTFSCDALEAGQTLAQYRPSLDIPRPSCVIEPARGRITLPNDRCAIPLDQNERKVSIERWQTAHEKFKTEYPLTKILDLISSQIVLAFENHQSLRHRIWTTSVDRISKMQSQTQLTLEHYLDLIMRSQEMAGPLGRFEMNSLRRLEIEDIRLEILARSADVIEVLFDRQSKDLAIERLSDVRSRWRRLTGDLVGNTEVRKLGQAIDDLITILGEI